MRPGDPPSSNSPESSNHPSPSLVALVGAARSNHRSTHRPTWSRTGGIPTSQSRASRARRRCRFSA